MTGRADPPEQACAEIAGRAVRYTLLRTRRRSIGLHVDSRGLTVRMPLRASGRWLSSVLHRHADWILSKLDDWARRPRPVPWDETSVFPLLGGRYAYAPRQGGGFDMIELGPGQLPLPLATGVAPTVVERQVSAWYRAQALECFRKRVAHFCHRLQLPVPEVKLSNARTQWGSCSHTTGIRLSWRLAMHPLHLVDYVVAHEVAHLLEMNHSARFWRVVARLCPEYTTARRELGALG